MQATETFIDIVAQQTIACVAYETRTGEVVLEFHTLAVNVALGACCLALFRVSN